LEKATMIACCWKV
jgi:hypothetical protein